jgi:hypothetical protein
MMGAREITSIHRKCTRQTASEVGQIKIECIPFCYIEVGSKCTFESVTSVTGDCSLLGCDAVSRGRSLIIVTSNVSKGPFGLAFCPDLQAAGSSETFVASFQTTRLYIPEDGIVYSTSR